MNRRSFFVRTAGALVAAACAPLLRPARAVAAGWQTLTYRGIPIEFDAQCASNRIYYITSDALYVYDGAGPMRRISEDS